MMSLQKNILFCDGEVFSLDRGLLMGANSTTLPKLQVSNEYHLFLAILKVLINSRYFSSHKSFILSKHFKEGHNL